MALDRGGDRVLNVAKQYDKVLKQLIELASLQVSLFDCAVVSPNNYSITPTHAGIHVAFRRPS